VLLAQEPEHVCPGISRLFANPTPWPGCKQRRHIPQYRHSAFCTPLSEKKGRGDIGSSGMAAVRLSSLRVLDGGNSPDPSGHSDFSCRKGRAQRSYAKQAKGFPHKISIKSSLRFVAASLFFSGTRLKFSLKFLLRRFLSTP